MSLRCIAGKKRVRVSIPPPPSPSTRKKVLRDRARSDDIERARFMPFPPLPATFEKNFVSEYTYVHLRSIRSEKVRGEFENRESVPFGSIDTTRVITMSNSLTVFYEDTYTKYSVGKRFPTSVSRIIE